MKRLIFFILAFSLLSPSAMAVQPETLVNVTVFYDEQGAPANAVSGVLSYDPTVVHLNDVTQTQNLVSLWIQSPYESLDAEDGTVEFSGVNPGGFGIQLAPSVNGVQESAFFKAQFSVLTDGDPAFQLSDVRLLANDGSGTELSADRVRIERSDGVDSEERTLLPPEDFTPVLAHDPSVFDGRWFVSFSTVDPDGAIDHFEVKEGWGAYQEAASPYMLSRLGWLKPVWVKAVDSDGMETVERVSGLLRLEAIILFVALILVACWLLVRARRVRGLLVLMLLLQPFSAMAATEYVWPVEASFGAPFSVSVRTSSEDQALNAVSGVLNYPADLLKVTSISKSGSIVDLWPTEPSSQSGAVSFSGIVLNPGFTGTGGLILTVTFAPIRDGVARVTWADASVLANDGYGTDILQATGTGTYSLSIQPVRPTTPAVSPVVHEEPAPAEETVAPLDPDSTVEPSVLDDDQDKPFSMPSLDLALKVSLAVLSFVLLLLLLRRLPYRIAVVRVQPPASSYYRKSDAAFARAFALLKKATIRHAREHELDAESMKSEVEKLERHVNSTLEKIKK